MKKRIFVSAHYLEIGGAEISLIGLLNSVDYDKYDVDLFLYSHRGELMQYIPPQVRVLPEISAYAGLESTIKKVIKGGNLTIGIRRLIAKYKYYRWSSKKREKSPEAYYQFVDNAVMPYLPSLHNYGMYDLAVNFIGLRNHIPTKVLSRKTITWIHTDYASISVDSKLELPSWQAYDYIASISQTVTSSFLHIFPSLKDKIIEIENILSKEFVRTRAEQGDVESEMASYGDGIRLLSIGRFCYQKNYDNVPNICRRILDAGYNIKWFLIGFGLDEELIKKKIEENHIGDHVIILGKRSNPYPYIKASDIYIQPSRYEGKSVVVREAQMLGKPVVVTNYKTATSQIRDGFDGIIAPMDNQGCAEAIMKLIENKNLQTSLKEYCDSHDFSNVDEIKKLYELMD